MAIREHPILFTGPMVQAILDDRKTQTRRVMKPQPLGPCKPTSVPGGWCDFGAALVASSSGVPTLRCPYGGPGDVLWVKETYAARIDIDWRKDPEKAKHYAHFRRPESNFHPRSDHNWHDYGGCWRSGRFMPRCLADITLEVLDVRVQRVQEITCCDALAEGARYDENESPHMVLHTFQELWDSINARRGYGWATNPWVWAITFKRKDG